MFQDKAGLFGKHGAGSGSGSGSGARPGAAEWITAYCDGGSRGNPGPAGFGVFIEGPDGENLAELGEYIGKATNNVAEYSALLAALQFALEHGYRRLRVVADSELMVKQMQGRYKVNSPDLRPLYEEAKRRAAQLEMFRAEHVLRGKNQKADRLANLAMDRGMGRSGTGRPGTDRPGTDRPGTDRPGAGTAAGEGHGGPRPSAAQDGPAARTLKGYVQGGVVHLLEGELPDGVFVQVTVDRQ